jgi:hypothetical protein
MSDITKQMRRELEEFNLENKQVLQATASVLLEQGILKVHYGMDYVNDDGDAAEYAVLEYKDGRIEELDHWLEALDYDTFIFSLRYCNPYSFDTTLGKVFFDKDGGMIDGEHEGIIRAYHSQTRREMLEQESADVEPWELDGFSGSNTNELKELAKGLLLAGIAKVFFGVDYTENGCELSDWAIAKLVFDHSEQPLEKFTALNTQFREMLTNFVNDYELPGVYYFDCENGWLFSDPQGGMVDMGDELERSYHTEEQRVALED